MPTSNNKQQDGLRSVCAGIQDSNTANLQRYEESPDDQRSGCAGFNHDNVTVGASGHRVGKLGNSQTNIINSRTKLTNTESKKDKVAEDELRDDVFQCCVMYCPNRTLVSLTCKKLCESKICI